MFPIRDLAEFGVARKGSSPKSAPMRRSQIVWLCFGAAMTAVTGLLALGDHTARPGFAATKTTWIEPLPARDPIFRLDRPLDRGRFGSIIIHDSGEPAGDAESIRRLHVDHGYRMMGFHFLIGNGNGMGDGALHVGERWIRQLPGWHTVGPQADEYNAHAVAICLVGNGDRRPPTQRQLAALISLVRRLQSELRIPASGVRLHRDVAGGLTGSPGRFFPAARLQQQLLDPMR